jgi:hypothetical protein
MHVHVLFVQGWEMAQQDILHILKTGFIPNWVEVSHRVIWIYFFGVIFQKKICIFHIQDCSKAAMGTPEIADTMDLED